MSTGLMGRRRAAKKQDDDEAPVNSRQVAILKLQRDLADLEDLPNVKLKEDPSNPLKFSVIITVPDGYWKGGRFEFEFVIPDNFPYGAPNVTLLDPIWHPNIDLQGKPCVNVLQKGWKPTITIQHIIFALLFLFSDPNYLDPLNVEAAEEMRNKNDTFRKHVLTALKGGDIHGRRYPGNAGDSNLFGTGRV